MVVAGILRNGKREEVVALSIVEDPTVGQRIVASSLGTLGYEVAYCFLFCISLSSIHRAIWISRFHLYKENKDTQEALGVIGKMLGVQVWPSLNFVSTALCCLLIVSYLIVH